MTRTSGEIPRRRLFAVAALLLMTAGPAAGQDVRPSEPIPIDTLQFGLAPADTVPVLAPRFRGGPAQAELAAVPDEDRLPRNPRNAAIRSFLLPGWGQWHTGHPIRGIGFALAEVGFAWLGYRQQREALNLQDELQAAREAFFADPPPDLPEDPILAEEAFDRTIEAVTIRAELDNAEGYREDFYAYAALAVIFSAMDAYVAAQLDPLDVGAEPSGRVRASVRLPWGDR
ncbi:MAG TPA: DUF5683 domain-containing protein [Gemmatimonadota bacterium]|nr:DUF5683 domain-containing protein [Gemmatimonadota bacterium]